MKDLIATSIKYQNGRLHVLDQRLLPGRTHWRRCRSADDMIEMIKTLHIRGAPLIGVGASLILADLAERGASAEQLLADSTRLQATRPTAVNLSHCMDRIRSALAQHGPRGLSHCAEQLFEEDVALCDRIAQHGAALIPENSNILTHCNTGSLATVGVGTAVGVINILQKQGKKPHVWVGETRPLLQGGRLTVWEMQHLGVDHTLICDSMAALLMQQGKVDFVLVGCDRIAVNGDVANKIGTYSLAVCAYFHRIPFYVVGPYTTLDKQCPDGQSIPIEEREDAEVLGVSGDFGDVQWSMDQTPVYNPAFGITPAKLITGWVLDTGVYTHEQVQADILATL